MMLRSAGQSPLPLLQPKGSFDSTQRQLYTAANTTSAMQRRLCNVGNSPSANLNLDETQPWSHSIMLFSKTVVGDVVRVEIKGQLDSLTAPELRSSFETLVQERPQKIVLDLSELRLIDSSGVGAIVSLFKQARAMGSSFDVIGVQGQPRSIFQVLRLDRVFSIA